MTAMAVNNIEVDPIENNKHGSQEHQAGWYILRCCSGLELPAEQWLRDSGWKVFLPRELKWRPTLWRKKPKQGEAEYPRFPGYLFIDLAPPTWPQWDAWPFSAFIRGILCMDGRPVPLAQGELERLRAEDGLAVPYGDSVPLHRAFTAGQDVRVLAGPFRGFSAQLDAIDEDGGHITVHIFGRPAEVPVPLTWLEAA